ncbi:hypothetical protein Bp8pS_009 [Bacillus phage vB_BpuM-BpSp]|nr:hypothetical protein Bp8pS_009 [Bacillus phage vB_BpuM-BpSp]
MKETQIISCKASSSISSLIGNATGYARSFLQEVFPPNFFKDTYIIDSLNEVRLEDDKIIKLSKPLLVIDTQYTAEDSFMELLPKWHTTQYFTFKKPHKQYNGVLYDEKNNIYIYSIPDRIKMDFNVKIVLQTKLSALNVLHYIRQNFEVGGRFYLNDVRLQTRIPKLYTTYIAQRLNLNLKNQVDRNKLEEYLFDNSYNGISESIDTASGTSKYYYNYKTNILTHFPDIPTVEVNTEGLVIKDSTVEFNFSFDFWSHSNFVMEIKDDVPDIPLDLEDDGKMKYEFQVPTHFIREQIDNMHLLKYKGYEPDINTEIDYLQFERLLDPEIREVLEEAIKAKLNLKELFNVKVLLDNKELDEGFFEVDWKNTTLKTKDPLKNVMYTIIIYGNLKRLNLIRKYIMDDRRDLIKTIEDIKK